MSRLPPNFHAVQISLDLPRILSVPPFTKLPNPNPIDSWLALNYTDTIRDIYSPGHLYLGDLLSDEMLCILQLNAQMIHSDDFFADFFVYSLLIYAEAPLSSGISVANILSPLATLGRYEGLASDPEAPLWTRMCPGSVITLRQHRNSVAEIFAQIARWTENSPPLLSESMLEWAQCAVTTGSAAANRVRSWVEYDTPDNEDFLQEAALWLP